MSDPVTVAVLHDLPDAEVRRIEAVSPRLRVIRAAEAASGYFRAQREGVEAAAKAAEAIRPALAEAEILYGIRFDRSLFAAAPRLRWVQTMTAGVDHLLNLGLEDRGIRLTASHIHRIQIGEYVLTMLLALTKRLPDLLRIQRERRWERPELDEVYEKTIGIVGFGVIGRRVAEIAKVLGMQVVAMRRRPPQADRDESVDRWYPADRLREMLAECDYVLLAVPGTPATAGLIGSAELAAMKPTAYLINIARGSVVDEAALIEALRDRRIAGAALDVFVKEPLPADSPLWDLDNLILTAHISGPTARYNERAVDLFCENLRRYLAGDPLINEVDYAAGY
ncbi:MAG TPA: D-2-hydroxyacid dehydrogenase [Dehalococcoidia bacterium]|nr:D-2-hydroxyacid dehydrogenase [Dehalococcoidia bacterium]